MWLLVTMWVLSLVLSTVFMSIYIKKYKTPGGITAVYVVYLALSQILASKIVLLSEWTVPAAVIIYPFTYQLTDTMNEHFGLKETKKMVITAFVTQILMVIFIYFGNSLPAFEYGPVTDEQWLSIFSQQAHIITASWISFLFTSYLDAWLFAKVKEWTKGKYLWIRSVLSDVPMLALDSLIFISLAFGFLNPTPLWDLVPNLIIGQMITKWFFGVVDTPFIYLDRYLVYGKVRKNNSEEGILIGSTST